MSFDLFDGHCDTVSRCLDAGESLADNGGQLDLRRTDSFGRYAQFFAFYYDPDAALQPTAEARLQAERETLARELARNRGRVALCGSAREAEDAFAAGKRAAFWSLEGAELLGCDPDRLPAAHTAGVRSVNLTWNHANALSGSCREEPERGLSARGRRFVAGMETLGMLVDVSHLSDAGFWDVEAQVSGPFWASHSDCREVFFHPRNLTDAQITAIIKHQGCIGLNLCPDFLGVEPGTDALLRHLDHLLALGGEHAVILGCDWDGLDFAAPDFRDITSMETLHEELLRRYPDALVRDLFFNNLMGIVSRVCNI